MKFGRVRFRVKKLVVASIATTKGNKIKLD